MSALFYEGIKIYINDDFQTLSNKNVLVWDKRLAPNNSFAVSQVQWNCRNKRRLTLEMTMYRANQTVIGTTNKFEWESVIPGTISDVMFQQICGEKQRPQYVEIIADRTPLYFLPLEDSQILKTAKKRSRFLLIPDNDETVWFNIVDEKTQQDLFL